MTLEWTKVGNHHQLSKKSAVPTWPKTFIEDLLKENMIQSFRTARPEKLSQLDCDLKNERRQDVRKQAAVKLEKVVTTEAKEVMMSDTFSQQQNSPQVESAAADVSGLPISDLKEWAPLNTKQWL